MCRRTKLTPITSPPVMQSAQGCQFSFGCNSQRFNLHLCDTFSHSSCWTWLAACKKRKKNHQKTLKWKQSKILGDLALQCFGVTDFTSVFWVTLEGWKGKFSCSSEIAHVSAHLLMFCNFVVWKAYIKRMPQLTTTFHHPQKLHNPSSQ